MSLNYIIEDIKERLYGKSGNVKEVTHHAL